MQSHKVDRAIQARRAYQKKWRAKNKDRVREYNRRYWERRAEREDKRLINKERLMMDNLNKIPRMLKITEIAELYELPVHFVRTLVNNGEVVAVQVGNKVLVNAEKFGEYLESNKLLNDKGALVSQEHQIREYSNQRVKPISLKRGRNYDG